MAQSVHSRLTLYGWAYLVGPLLIFLGAIIQRINPLVLLTGLLVGPLILSWRGVRRILNAVKATRHFPREIAAGDLLVVEVHARNLSRSPCWALRLQDEVRRVSGADLPASQGDRRTAHAEPLRPELLISWIGGKQHEHGSYRGQLMERGRYELGPLRATTVFPLGFVLGTRELAGKETLLVLPRLGSLAQRWTELHREAEVGGSQTHLRHGAHEGEFFGLRDWRNGDSVRWIHWRTSAKRGRLSVKQFAQPQNQDFALLLDLWRPAHPTPADWQHVELAISFAATIIASLFRGGGSHLCFAMHGAQNHLTQGPVATALVKDLMERLSLAEPVQENGGLGKLLHQAFGQIRSNMTVLLVSSRSIDLHDRQQFGSLWAETAKANLAARTRFVSTASPDFAEYFVPG